MTRRNGKSRIELSYIDSVLSGARPVAKILRQAVERHVNDLEHGAERGLWFDDAAAQRALKMCTVVHHSKGEWAGQTFVPQPWEEFIIASLFGWKRADGMRRFRRAYIEVPRKNGKSFLGAFVGNYLLVADNEPGAEIYSVATTLPQARIVHTEAARMVQASPILRREIKKFKDNLNVESTHSKYEPLGGDSDVLDGLNVHGAIIDEIHAHKTRGVVDILDTATGARRQPLIFEITTAGYDRFSVCWEHHDWSRQILDGLVTDDTWFAFIAAAEEGDDWTSPATWEKANPNYGISVKPEDLRIKCARAQKIPAEQNTFKRLHLNLWTEQDERWIDLEQWRACGAEIDLKALEDKPCYAGLDLASTTDIAALVLVFPTNDDPSVFTILPFFWIPEDSMQERTRRANVPYASWVSEGHMAATEGNVIDYRAILEKLRELQTLYTIQELAYDRWGATQLAQQMQDIGLDIVPFGQGFASMSPPTKELMTVILARRLQHGNHPVLNWMAGNMVVTQDPAGNLKPDKSKATEKIDGMVALIMGLDRAIRRETGSVYESGGLFVL